MSRRVLRASQRSWWTASLAGQAAVVARDFGAGRPVLVHQMGKVASTALADAIAPRVARPVYHLHFLSREGIAYADRVYRENWGTSPIPRHVWESKRVRRMLNRRGSEPWDVVTVVRDPVERNISAFFQVAFTQYRLDVGSLPPEALRAHFLDIFDEHDRPLSWIDDELDPIFETDVYSSRFPHEQGWTLVTSPRARVAVLRYEDLETAVAPALETLLDVRLRSLGFSNRSAAKHYGHAQRRFADAVTLPDAYLDMMYESKYARHFYTEEERERQRQRWAERD